MTCNIVPFPTKNPELQFIANTKRILERLQKESISLEEKISLLYQLEKLYTEFLPTLPSYYFDLWETLMELVERIDAKKHWLYNINQAFILCNIHSKELSAESFRTMSNCHFYSLYSLNFPEEALLEIINDLTEHPEKYVGKQGYKTRKNLWFDISQSTTTKKVFLEAIKHVDLRGDDFLEFAFNVIFGNRDSEEVLLSLIDRMEKCPLSNNLNTNAMIKTKIYLFMLESAPLTIRIFNTIIKNITLPSIDEYYNFFSDIIKDFLGDLDVLTAVKNRIDNDAQALIANTNSAPYYYRLKILFQNL